MRGNGGKPCWFRLQIRFTSLEDGIRSLLTSQLDLFVQMGRNLFRGFATILIAWFAVQAALSSAEGGDGFNFTRFSRLLLVIAFGFAMVTYYSTPIPGIGNSFSDYLRFTYPRYRRKHILQAFRRSFFV